MDKDAAVKIIIPYINTVREAGYRVVAAYIFGSVAKGTAGQESDIDVALVIDGLTDTFDTQVELMKLRRKVDLRIEPHPFSSSESAGDSAFLQEVLSTGIRVA